MPSYLLRSPSPPDPSRYLSTDSGQDQDVVVRARRLVNRYRALLRAGSASQPSPSRNMPAIPVATGLKEQLLGPVNSNC